IVRAGHMVALGTIAELRHTDTTTWRVDAPAAPPTWAARAGIPGAVVLTDGPDARVQLPTGEDEAAQQLLRAALEHSPVREFAAVQPPLSDLFRHVVTEPGGEEEEGDEKRAPRRSGSSRSGSCGRACLPKHPSSPRSSSPSSSWAASRPSHISRASPPPP